MIDTNNKGLGAALTRAVLPGMVARNRGHIIQHRLHGGQLALCPAVTSMGDQTFGAPVQPQSSRMTTTAPRCVTDIEPGLVGGTEFSNVRLKAMTPKPVNLRGTPEA